MRMFTLLLVCLISGCACNPFHCTPKIVVQEVKVPVAVLPPKPPVLASPNLPLDTLAKEASDKQTAEAYWESILLLKKAVKERDIVIDSYRNFQLENTK